TTSVGPPAANGTRILTVPVGKSVCCAPAAPLRKPIRARLHSDRASIAGSSSACPRRRGPEGVAAINILAELHDAIRHGPGGNVDPMERHRSRQPGVLPIAGADDVVDLLARPVGRLREQPGHQLAHVLHTDAARRMETEVLAEQILKRRVVHIDAVLAWE